MTEQKQDKLEENFSIEDVKSFVQQMLPSYSIVAYKDSKTDFAVGVIRDNPRLRKTEEARIIQKIRKIGFSVIEHKVVPFSRGTQVWVHLKVK